MKFKRIYTNLLLCLLIGYLLIGCPSDNDKPYVPITTKEVETQNLIKKSLDSNALAIDLEKLKSELIFANKRIKLQKSVIAKQLDEINNKKNSLNSFEEKQKALSLEILNLKKLQKSLNNNLEDKNKLINEYQQKNIGLDEKLKLFHKNSEKLNSTDLKEKTQYIKDLIIEVKDLKKEIKKLNDKVIELEQIPLKQIPD
ncbi:MAG: hypothetical protein COA79_14630 [Planctomycetota bacterium]|nr:MAG: hypothetical protein COA79_14630 [Planctomycetota bacterium]